MVDFFQNFFSNLITGIYQLVIYLVSFILQPIDLILTNLIPGYNDIITNINTFFSNIATYINFAISFTGFYQSTVTIIKAEILFILTAPVTAFAIKLAVKWFKSLKVG